jgi:hypothetical protein
MRSVWEDDMAVMAKKKAGAVATPVSIRFGQDDATMKRVLEARARATKRSLSDTMKYYAHLGLVAKDNPDLPMGFIEGVLEGIEESRAGLSVPYQWGVVK